MTVGHYREFALGLLQVSEPFARDVDCELLFCEALLGKRLAYFAKTAEGIDRLWYVRIEGGRFVTEEWNNAVR